MSHGVAKADYRNVEFDKRKLEEFLRSTQYADSTKEAIRLVMVEGQTYKEAGRRVGVTRQRVFDRVKDCCHRMGLDVSLERFIVPPRGQE